MTGHKWSRNLIQAIELAILSSLWWINTDQGQCKETAPEEIEKVPSLTVNSPVTESKPTCIVCSKSEGLEISGRSLSLSFFLPSTESIAVVRGFWPLAKWQIPVDNFTINVPKYEKCYQFKQTNKQKKEYVRFNTRWCLWLCWTCYHYTILKGSMQ